MFFWTGSSYKSVQIAMKCFSMKNISYRSSSTQHSSQSSSVEDRRIHVFRKKPSLIPIVWTVRWETGDVKRFFASLETFTKEWSKKNLLHLIEDRCRETDKNVFSKSLTHTSRTLEERTGCEQQWADLALTLSNYLCFIILLILWQFDGSASRVCFSASEKHEAEFSAAELTCISAALTQAGLD